MIFLTRSSTFHPNIPPNIACRPAAPTLSSIQDRATDFDPNTEIIALPHGWTAILQTAEMLPAGPVCAALETLYTVLIERSFAVQQIEMPEGSIRPATYRLGNLRFALSLGTRFGTLDWLALEQLFHIMLERATRRMGLSWNGVLVHGDGHVWVVALGVGANLLGWP